MFFIGLITGLVIGGMVGLFIMAILQAGSDGK